MSENILSIDTVALDEDVRVCKSLGEYGLTLIRDGDDLITAVITEYGIARPPYTESFKRIFKQKSAHATPPGFLGRY
jgi:methylthioribose-1-phosphate isomerase